MEKTPGAIMDRPIKLLLADDHELVLIGLRMILEREGFAIVGEALTGGQALRLARETKPDVVILDILMPDMGGLEVLQEFRSLDWDPKVIVTTAHSKPEYLREAIRLGAAGYISKDEHPASIVAAVQSVAEGGTALSKEDLIRVFEDVKTSWLKDQDQSMDVDADLTPRQLTVAALVGHGLDNSEIAEELDISVNTVKSHLREIYTRIGLTDRTKVALWAVEQGLIDEP